MPRLIQELTTLEFEKLYEESTLMREVTEVHIPCAEEQWREGLSTKSRWQEPQHGPL